MNTPLELIKGQLRSLPVARGFIITSHASPLSLKLCLRSIPYPERHGRTGARTIRLDFAVTPTGPQITPSTRPSAIDDCRSRTGHPPPVHTRGQPSIT